MKQVALEVVPLKEMIAKIERVNRIAIKIEVKITIIIIERIITDQKKTMKEERTTTIMNIIIEIAKIIIIRKIKIRLPPILIKRIIRVTIKITTTMEIMKANNKEIIIRIVKETTIILATKPNRINKVKEEIIITITDITTTTIMIRITNLNSLVNNITTITIIKTKIRETIKTKETTATKMTIKDMRVDHTLARIPNL